jgi:hypothetical protein
MDNATGNRVADEACEPAELRRNGHAYSIHLSGPTTTQEAAANMSLP